jgi:hypothetical protein
MTLHSDNQLRPEHACSEIETRGIVRAEELECGTATRFIAEAWPHLPPHIREAIFVMVDSALIQFNRGVAHSQKAKE